MNMLESITQQRLQWYFLFLVVGVVLIPSLVFSTLWWPKEEGEGLLTRRSDRLDLYERNRDRANWDVRENWQYQKRAYLEGNTRIRANNFRRRSHRSEYEPPTGRQYPYRPQ